jgi:chaperonin GroES
MFRVAVRRPASVSTPRPDATAPRSLPEVLSVTNANVAAGKLVPLADRVVVRALEETGGMRGGLYIPDTAKEKPQQGEVVAAGPGRFDEKGGQRIPMDVKVGDKVLYGKYSGTEVTVDGEQLLILRESDVLAIVG